MRHPLRQDDCDYDADLYRRPLAGDNSYVIYDDFVDTKDADDEAEKEGASASDEEKSVRRRGGLHCEIA